MRLFDTTRRTAAALAICLCVAAPAAHAQERHLPPFVLGLGAGYDIGSGLIINNGSDDRAYDQSASLRSAGVSFIFPKVFMNGWGVTTSIFYGNFDLGAHGVGERTVFVGGAPTSGTTEHTYDLLLRFALLELATHIHIGGNARLEVGGFGGVGFFPEYSEREKIVGPAGATFSNGAVVWSDSGSTVNDGALLSGGQLRVGYEIPFFGGMALLPSVTFRGIVAFDGDGEGIAAGGTAGLGIALLTGRTGGEPLEPVPVGAIDTVTIVDTLERPVPADARATLRAQVDLYSLDSNGRRADTLVISMRRTLRRLEVPLDATLAFEPKSAALPARTVTTPSEATAFSEDDLVAMRPSEIRRRSVEIVASRMRANPSMRLTLSGSRVKGEPAWFAEARARSVRGYLHAVWGVDSSRVTIASDRSTSRSGEASVRIASSSTSALAPVVSEWIEQEVDAAPIGVQPTIVSEEGVQRWRVSVMQGDREIGVVRNTDEQDARQLDIGMALRRLTRDEARRSLGAELVVEDSSGGVAVARDRLEVVVDTAAGGVDGASAETFIGEFVVPVLDTAATSRAIERIVMALPANARVTVSAPIEITRESERAVRQLRALAASRGRSIASLDHAAMPADGERLDASLAVIGVRGTITP
jgi:hypothetical protein